MINTVVEYERDIISLMYRHPGVIDYVASKIKVDDIINIADKTMFRALVDLSKKGRSIDIRTIYNEYFVNSQLTVSQLLPYIDHTVSAHIVNIDWFINEFNNKLKEIKIAAFIPQEKIQAGESLDRIKTDFNSLLDAGVDEDIIADFDEVSKITKDYLASGNDNIIQTGFERFDMKIGIRNTNLIVLAASPKQGKTTFALNMMMNMAHKGSKCLYFSFEMSVVELGIKLNQRTNKEFNSKNVIIVEASSKTIAEIEMIIKKEKPDIVFVDQLDCIPVNTSQERHDLRLGENVIALKKMTMKNKIPIVLLHQLHRDAAKSDKDPQVYNLKDTSILEQKADAVLLLYADKKRSSFSDIVKPITLSVGANRMGAIGTIDYMMDGSRCLFYEDFTTERR